MVVVVAAETRCVPMDSHMSTVGALHIVLSGHSAHKSCPDGAQQEGTHFAEVRVTRWVACAEHARGFSRSFDDIMPPEDIGFLGRRPNAWRCALRKALQLLHQPRVLFRHNGTPRSPTKRAVWRDGATRRQQHETAKRGESARGGTRQPALCVLRARGVDPPPNTTNKCCLALSTYRYSSTQSQARRQPSTTARRRRRTRPGDFVRSSSKRVGVSTRPACNPLQDP
jgi:hypothetical protein